MRINWIAWIFIGFLIGAFAVMIMVIWQGNEAMAFYRNETYCGWAIKDAVSKCAYPPKQCDYNYTLKQIICKQSDCRKAIC